MAAQKKQEPGPRVRGYAVVPNSVIFDGHLSLAARVVYAALASYADWETRTCYPKQTTIAKQTGLDERRVRRAIKELLDGGHILVHDRRSENKPNVYVLTTGHRDPVVSDTSGDGRPEPTGQQCPALYEEQDTVERETGLVTQDGPGRQAARAAAAELRARLHRDLLPDG